MAQPDTQRSAPRSDALATRARIVAAAERLFAERGIDAVSLVEIGKAAGQRNRSAVQYHFADKRGVIHAILDKHTPGIEVRRHAMLDQLEAAGTATLRRLVEVLVLPAVEKLDDPDGGPEFLLLNAELVGHPRYPLLDLDAERVNRAGERLRRLTTAAAPSLPDAQWVPRWLLVTGLLFHGIADWIRVGETLSRRRAAPTRDDFVGPIIAAIQAVMGSAVAKGEPVTANETGTLGLGPIDQVSYVVADMGRALPRYEALYGTFRVGETPLSGCTIRGCRADCTLKVAVNNAGPIEVELIEVVAGQTPHSEHLKAHGEGLHHVRFRVQGIDAKLEELQAQGFETVFYKRFGPTVAFAYLEAPAEIGGSLIELLEMP